MRLRGQRLLGPLRAPGPYRSHHRRLAGHDPHAGYPHRKRLRQRRQRPARGHHGHRLGPVRHRPGGRNGKDDQPPHRGRHRRAGHSRRRSVRSTGGDDVPGDFRRHRQGPHGPLRDQPGPFAQSGYQEPPERRLEPQSPVQSHHSGLDAAPDVPGSRAGTTGARLPGRNGLPQRPSGQPVDCMAAAALRLRANYRRRCLCVAGFLGHSAQLHRQARGDSRHRAGQRAAPARRGRTDLVVGSQGGLTTGLRDGRRDP